MYNYYILITQHMLQTFWPNTSAYVLFVSVTENKATENKDLRKPFHSMQQLLASTWNCYKSSRLKRISAGFSQDRWLWLCYLDPLLQYAFYLFVLNIIPAYLCCFKQKKNTITSWFFLRHVWTPLVLITFLPIIGIFHIPIRSSKSTFDDVSIHIH